MTFSLLYLWGCAWALGSALAAVSRHEMGIMSIWWDSFAEIPWWALALEVLAACLGSWATVGFCQVQNAYRASGRPGLSCGINRIK